MACDWAGGVRDVVGVGRGLGAAGCRQVMHCRLWAWDVLLQRKLKYLTLQVGRGTLAEYSYNVQVSLNMPRSVNMIFYLRWENCCFTWEAVVTTQFRPSSLHYLLQTLELKLGDNVQDDAILKEKQYSIFCLSKYLEIAKVFLSFSWPNKIWRGFSIKIKAVQW